MLRKPRSQAPPPAGGDSTDREPKPENQPVAAGGRHGGENDGRRARSLPNGVRPVSPKDRCNSKPRRKPWHLVAVGAKRKWRKCSSQWVARRSKWHTHARPHERQNQARLGLSSAVRGEQIEHKEASREGAGHNTHLFSKSSASCHWLSTPNLFAQSTRYSRSMLACTRKTPSISRRCLSEPPSR